jgi:hypothetical protein
MFPGFSHPEQHFGKMPGEVSQGSQSDTRDTNPARPS